MLQSSIKRKAYVVILVTFSSSDKKLCNICVTFDWISGTKGLKGLLFASFIPAGIYLFKFNNRNTRTRYKYVQSLQ